LLCDVSFNDFKKYVKTLNMEAEWQLLILKEL
jgi:hypothetical protein